jgi:hypothetical protein
MSSERIFKIVIMELTSDNLKLEAELEKTINSDLEINEKTNTIKTILAKMVAIDGSIVKFTNMITNNNNNKLKED